MYGAIIGDFAGSIYEYNQVKEVSEVNIKELTKQELLDKLAEENANLVRVKLSHSVSPLDNPSQIKAIRKNIARMNTELSLRSKNN